MSAAPRPLRRSVSRLPAAEAALDTHCTDLGNAARFARDHHHHVRYVPGLGFLVWDCARWKADDTGEVERLARDTVRAIYAEAADELDAARRQELAAWAQRSEDRRRIESMLRLAQTELGIAAVSHSFDRDSFLLNTASGIVDLHTGELGDHDPAKSMTKLAPTFYDPKAACPRFLTFLDRIMAGDLDLIEFLQRAFGYSLTAETTEQVIFLLFGHGANGKTVLLEVMRAVWGDYAIHAAAETFLVKRDAGPRPDLARLRGARMATAAETDDGRRMAEALVKQLSGGDTITARHLYQREIEFRPAFKLWLATNHKPVIRGTDYAIWRRIRLLPFTITIPPPEQDLKLREKLLAEAPGILAWAVEGCLAWQKQGLGLPEAVRLATGAYREEQDQVSRFLLDEAMLEPGCMTPAGQLYNTFKLWSERQGERPLRMRDFAPRLEARGLTREHSSSGAVWVGVGLMAEGE